jgi:hypothetical protein
MDQDKTEQADAQQNDTASLLNALRNGLWAAFGLWMGVVLYYRFMDPPAPRFVAIVSVVIAGAALLAWIAEWLTKKRSGKRLDRKA